MAQDAYSLRRRAALAALRPVLDDSTLIEALWYLQENMHGDSVSDVIRYVDALAQRHLLDPRTIKRLYEQIFHALKNPDAPLPEDPWPAMQATRSVTRAVAPPTYPSAASYTAPRPNPAPISAPIPAPVVVAPPVAAPAPVAAPTPDPTPQRPVEQIIFGAFIRALLSEIQQFHGGALNDLRTDTVKAVTKLRISSGAKEQFKLAWSQPGQDEWHIAAPPAELSELTHLIYVGLCEAIGPVDADQILTRAVRAVERMPQARVFSPRRLL